MPAPPWLHRTLDMALKDGNVGAARVMLLMAPDSFQRDLPAAAKRLEAIAGMTFAEARAKRAELLPQYEEWREQRGLSEKRKP
jgi:hypothetical protein